MGTAKRERQKANRALRRAEMAKQDRRDQVKRRTVRIGIVVVLIVGAVIAIAMIAGNGGGNDTDEADDPETPPTLEDDATPDGTAEDDPDGDNADGGPVVHEFAYGDGECAPDELPDDLPRRPTSEAPFAFDDAPPLCIDPESDYTATFVTSEGEIEVDLHTDQVPGTVNNFVNLARWGYYDDTVIFRGAASIGIIQGGGTTNTDRPGYTIPDEGEEFTYEAGQLAMARTGEPNSAGGQWFFNANDNASALDAQGTYVVFGTVTDGLDVTEEILALFGDSEMSPDREITLESVTITES